MGGRVRQTMVGRSPKGYQGPHNNRFPPLSSGVSANKSGKYTHRKVGIWGTLGDSSRNPKSDTGQSRGLRSTIPAACF